MTIRFHERRIRLIHRVSTPLLAYGVETFSSKRKMACPLCRRRGSLGVSGRGRFLTGF